MTRILIARGYLDNLAIGVVNGVSIEILRRYLEEYFEIPKASIDNRNLVHIWGIPKAGKYWYKIKPSDIVVIIPVKRSRKAKTAYITVIVDKLPNERFDNIEILKKLSSEIFRQIKVIIDRHGKKETKIYNVYPYLLFLRSKILSITINSLLTLLELSASQLAAYRRSIQFCNKVRKEIIEKLLNLIESSPSTDVLLKCLEEAYLELAGEYGEPVVTSPIVWGSEQGDGVFELLNKKLLEKGYRPLSWEEFVSFLKIFNSSYYYGIVYVSWGVGKRPIIDPLTIAIFAPIS